MSSSWIDRYASSWARHADVEDAAAIDEYLGFLDPDIRYEDVPSGAVYTGLAGVREMGSHARLMSADLQITILSVASDGATFAIEAAARGTNTGAIGPIPATGRRFVNRTVAFGEVSAAGLVTGHRDYWDLATFLGQVGVSPAPSG